MACVALYDIPQETCSNPFRAHEISESALQESWANVEISFPLQIRITDYGQMLPVSLAHNVFWPKLIDIAKNGDEENVRLRRWNYTDIFTLQATRDIPEGHKLQMWFSESLMISNLGIPPYLSAFNVKALYDIPQETCSNPFRAHEISESALQESWANVEISFPLQIRITDYGQMLPVSLAHNVFWPKLIDIAKNGDEENVRLRRWNYTDIFTLQATRDIPEGHKLQMWFSESLMISNLGIPPYLSAFNVKDSNNRLRPNATRFSCTQRFLAKVDCDEENVRLRRWNYTDIFTLQATRDIPEGHKLQMWFSESLMISNLGIPPYLSAFNVKGFNYYVCHQCKKSFDRPNPLKLHIGLQCDKLSLDTIWQRFEVYRPTPRLMNPPSLFNTSPAINSSVSSSPNIPSKQVGLWASSSSTIPTPVKRGEASDIVSVSPVGVALPPEVSGRSSLFQEQHYHHERWEDIVSNMGQAENGFVCEYCQKLYSTQYGLKIHLRSHSGYKPFLCKICHQAFWNPSNFSKHVRGHSDAQMHINASFH